MVNFCIVGTGGFARETLFLADDLKVIEKVDAFLEPDETWEAKWKDKMILGKQVLPYSSFKPELQHAVIAVGDPATRARIENELPDNTVYTSLIHPKSKLSKWVSIAPGAIICAGCILTTEITIGKHCQLNLQTTIGHDCNIGDFFTSAPSVNVSGNVNIGNQVYLGTGSAIKQGVEICNNATIGMGAMVIKHIDSAGTYIGIPAQKR